MTTWTPISTAPSNALLTQSNLPILTQDGSYILVGDIWGDVGDSQTPNWTPIGDSQTPGWAPVST